MDYNGMIMDDNVLPSGKRLHNYGNITMFNG